MENFMVIYRVVMLVIYLIFMIFMMISMWQLYVKAGEKGWKAIIPIWNTVVFIRISGRPIWWIILFIIPFLLSLITMPLILINNASGGDLPLFVVILLGVMGVSTIVSFVFLVLCSISFVKSFGYPGIFALLAILIPVIILPIMAFGDCKYVGPGGVVKEKI